MNISKDQTVELVIYNAINQIANNNLTIQGISGLIGFPATLIVDGAVLFTHYAPLVNSIREIYGQPPVDKDSMITVIKGVSSELLFDFTFDKIVGQIPIVGVYFNAICAKALTWRLGMLFAVLSAEGKEIEKNNVRRIIKLIRSLFPQKDIFKFSKPNFDIFCKLLSSASELNTFEEKVAQALKIFEENQE